MVANPIAAALDCHKNWPSLHVFSVLLETKMNFGFSRMPSQSFDCAIEDSGIAESEQVFLAGSTDREKGRT